MKAWWLVGLVAIWSGLAWILRRLRLKRWRDAANYVTAIEAWKSDQPMTLPPIRDRKARKARQAWQTTRFPQRVRK